jgi:glutamate-1-semialdehyde aminotransferase
VTWQVDRKALFRRQLSCQLVTAIHPRFPPDRARRDSKLSHQAKTSGTGTQRAPSASASRYHDAMAKQTTVRLPEDLAEEAEAVARVNGISVNALIIESLSAEIARVRADREFTTRVSKLLKRDKELLDRLAR